MRVDWSELSELVRDLDRAPAGLAAPLRKAVEISARKVKDAWRGKATGMAHAPAFPASITYDLDGYSGVAASGISAEIGPDKNRTQGALGNLIEFGSRNNAPQGLGQAALHETEPDFVSGVDKAVGDAMGEVGL